MAACRHCGIDRGVYPDVVDSQPVTKCRNCHRQVAAGPVLPHDQQIHGFTKRERYRPVSIDGITRPERPKRFKAGITTIEVIGLIAFIPFVCFLAILFGWVK